MAGIGSYEKGKKFTLKSGNTTPFKQMGSKDKHTEAKVGAALMLTKQSPKGRYNSGIPKDFNIKGGSGSGTPGFSGTKIAKKQAFKEFDKWHKTITSKPGGLVKGNISKPPSKLPPASTAKKELARKISAKNIKVDLATGKKASKGLQSKMPKGWDAAKKASTRYYKPTSTLGKTTTAFANTPKQFVKQAAKKGVGKVVSRALPVIGEALMTYDILKEGVKRVAKGIKTGKPQTGLYGKGKRKEPKGHGGKTWSERRTSKKKYIK